MARPRDPWTRSGAAPAEPPQQRRPPWPRPGPAGPRAPFRFPRQPPARTGRGRSLVEAAERRDVVQSAPATLRTNGSPPRAQRAGRGRGRAAGGSAAAIMRKGKHGLHTGFRAARHLYSAAVSETFCRRGRALPSPKMSGGGGGHVLAGLALPLPRCRRPLRGGHVGARAVSAGAAAGAARDGGEGGTGQRESRQLPVPGLQPGQRAFPGAPPGAARRPPQLSASRARELWCGGRERARSDKAGQGSRLLMVCAGRGACPCRGARRPRGGAGDCRNGGWCWARPGALMEPPHRSDLARAALQTRPGAHLRGWAGRIGIGVSLLGPGTMGARGGWSGWIW